MVYVSNSSSISFDRVADVYDATRGFPSEVSAQLTENILRLVSATTATRFLEPGIGTGRLALSLAEKGFSYTGVDISRKMLNQLRSKSQGKSCDLNVIRADAVSLPFVNGTFDVVLTAALLHLIPAWRQALIEIRRVLKPAGLYLHCWTQAERTTDEGLAFSRRWDSILTGFGVLLRKYGGSNEEISQELNAQEASLDTIAVAKWTSEQTVLEIIDLFAQKTYSELWQIPDGVLAAAIHELRDWCAKTFSSLDSNLPYASTLHITVARFHK